MVKCVPVSVVVLSMAIYLGLPVTTYITGTVPIMYDYSVGTNF